MKYDKKKKNLIITGLTILCIGLLGGSIAYFTSTLFENLNVTTTTKGLDYYITYNKGTDITSGTINPSATYTGGNSVTITLYKKDNTYDIYGHIYLDVTSIGDKLKNSNALKYAVVSGGNVISSGSMKGTSSGTSKLIATNIPLSTTSTTYSVYLWFDENDINDYEVQGETIKATVRCTASMKQE